MAPTPRGDGGTVVDPADRRALRRHLERFAGPENVSEAPDGTLTAEFGRSTHFAVDTEARVDSGMPLHGFDGPVEELRFDHGAGELRVRADGPDITYTFRRP